MQNKLAIQVHICKHGAWQEEAGSPDTRGHTQPCLQETLCAGNLGLAFIFLPVANAGSDSLAEAPRTCSELPAASNLMPG